MNRRSFLAIAAAGAAGLLIGEDPERALWVPGRKRIFLPPVPAPTKTLHDFLQVGDVFTIDNPAYYALDRRSGKPTGRLQQFVVLSVHTAPGQDRSIIVRHAHARALDPPTITEPKTEAEYWYAGAELKFKPKDRGWSHKRT